MRGWGRVGARRETTEHRHLPAAWPCGCSCTLTPAMWPSAPRVVIARQQPLRTAHTRQGSPCNPDLWLRRWPSPPPLASRGRRCTASTAMPTRCWWARASSPCAPCCCHPHWCWSQWWICTCRGAAQPKLGTGATKVKDWTVRPPPLNRLPTLLCTICSATAETLLRRPWTGQAAPRAERGAGAALLNAWPARGRCWWGK